MIRDFNAKDKENLKHQMLKEEVARECLDLKAKLLWVEQIRATDLIEMKNV